MAAILQGQQQNPAGAALGGGIGNVMQAMQMQKSFGNLLSGFGGQAQTPQRRINIEALRGITDPTIQMMAAKMLMQEQMQNAQGQQFGVAPGWLSYIRPENRPDAVKDYYLGKNKEKLSEELRKWQLVHEGTLDDLTGEPREGQERLARTALDRMNQLQSRLGNKPQKKKYTADKKPPGYPDAIWDSERKTWTVIRNGRLKGIK